LLLKLFVYGTLKRGYWNYNRFCQGVLSVEAAVVRGRLYELPAGFPVLKVPEEDILAHGTSDPIVDVATQQRLAEELDLESKVVKEITYDGYWGPIHGELMTFNDPEDRLPSIDRLEGFDPGGLSLYRRVLIPVIVNEKVTLAWVYIGVDLFHEARWLPQGVWPSG